MIKVIGLILVRLKSMKNVNKKINTECSQPKLMSSNISMSDDSVLH
jgi:hypothetical protein